MTTPTLNNQWPATASTAGAANRTVAVNVSALANRALMIWAACFNSSDNLAAGTCMVNGVSAGAPVVTPHASAANNYVYGWLFVAPPSGSYNVVITPSTTAIVDVLVEEWVDVDQSAPVVGTPDKTANGFQTSPLSRTIAAAATETIADFISIKVTGQTLTPAGTRVGSQINGVSGSVSGSYTPGASSGVSWTFTGSNSNVAFAGLVLKSAPVPATLSGNATLNDVDPGGGFGTSASDVAGNVALDAIAPGGSAGAVPGAIALSLRNANNGAVANTTIPWITVARASDAATVLTLANQTTDSSSALVLNNPSLVPGTWYVVTAFKTDGTAAGVFVKQAV